jgi:hypothetical protein
LTDTAIAARSPLEAEVDPNALTICHCTDCQTLTGPAFRADIPAAAEHFVLRGNMLSYMKTAESGNQRRHVLLRELRYADLRLRGGRSADLCLARRYY